MKVENGSKTTLTTAENGNFILDSYSTTIKSRHNEIILKSVHDNNDYAFAKIYSTENASNPGGSSGYDFTIDSNGKKAFTLVNQHTADKVNMELTGDLVSYSDIKLKKNISQLENSLDKIQKIRGVNYNWIEEKDDTKKQIGFIAQEIEDTFPELVETNKDNIKTLKYMNFVAVLTEGMKEQQKMIQNLQKEVEELKKKIH